MTTTLAERKLHTIELLTRLEDEELLEIRRMLARYFMQKAVNGATKVWEEKDYTAEKLLNEPS